MTKVIEYFQKICASVPLPLDFTLDVDGQGNHIVEAFRTINGQKEKISDIQDIWDYGKKIKINNKTYKLSSHDIEILLAMRSLEPEVTSEGSMVFPVSPNVLKYFRTKGSISETGHSSKLKILDKPLRPHAEVDFIPEKGLKVKTGYINEDSSRVVPLNELQLTKDRMFAREGNTFIPVPQDESPKIKSYLDHPEKLIELDDIPVFLKQDLDLLKSKMGTVLTDRASQVQVKDKPLRPYAEVDFIPEKGLKVKTGYINEDSGKIIPVNELNLTKDGLFSREGNIYFPVPHEDSPEIRSYLDRPEKLIELDDIPVFFERDLVLLKSKMGAVLTDCANKIKIINTPLKARVQVKTCEGGWLDFDISYKSGKYSLPHDFLKKTKEKYIQPDEKTWVQVDEESVQKTERLLEKLNVMEVDNGYRIPIARFCSLEEFIDSIGGLKEVTEEYQRFLNEISDFKTNESFHLTKGAEQHLSDQGIQLRSYQRGGIHWLSWLIKHGLHGILADDMGLGKTVQTISMLRLAYERSDVMKHSLVVCPKSVVHFWTREIIRCFPEAKIYEYVGSDRKQELWQHTEPIIFITTYETAARDALAISAIPLYFLILDEATKIKNPNTMRTQAIKSLNSMHRIALTGTPIENRAAELWSLFDFLMEGYLGSYGSFVRIFENPITAGDETASQNLAKKIRPFILRRLKQDVAKDIPEKIYMKEWCELGEEQRCLYGEIQSLYATKIRDALKKGETLNYTSTILPILTKLKQVCNHPALITGESDPVEGRSEKFDLTIKKVEEIRDQGESVVLFSHFLKSMDLFEMVFKKSCVSYIRIEGSTKDRQALIDQFNNKKVDVAICSIQACGYGINLTKANHVIHFDHWWNPAAEDQATDRVHRIGQEKTVYIYNLATIGTLEEKIISLLDKKRNLSDKVIGSAAKQKMKWSRDEMLDLLKPLE